MRVVLENGWRRVELVDRGEPLSQWEVAVNSVTRLRHGESYHRYLRRYLQDSRIVSALRTILNRQSAPSPLWQKSNQAVIDEIERRLTRGDLMLLKYEAGPLPYRTTPGAPGPEPEPAESESPPAEPAEEPAQCTNPDCKCQFEEAAEDGTPLVDADSVDCGAPAPVRPASISDPLISEPPYLQESLSATTPEFQESTAPFCVAAFQNAAEEGSMLVDTNQTGWAAEREAVPSVTREPEPVARPDRTAGGVPVTAASTEFHTCTNPACKSSFASAANEGSPLVDANAVGCGAPARVPTPSISQSMEPLVPPLIPASSATPAGESLSVSATDLLQCSNPACKSTFEGAADAGTALVDANAVGCGQPAREPAPQISQEPVPEAPAPQQPPPQLQGTNPGLQAAFADAAESGTPMIACGEHCQC